MAAYVITEIDVVDATGYKEWWSSKEYGPAKQVRQKTAVTNMIVVEGV